MRACANNIPANSDADLIERLRLALSPAHMTAQLARQWPFASHRGLPVTGCRVLRTHRNNDDGFVLEYAVRLGEGDTSRTEHLFGELWAVGAQARYRDVVRRLRSRKRRQLPRHEDTELVAYLNELGLVLRFPGLDERLPGLSWIHNMTKLQRLLEKTCVPASFELEAVSATRLGHRLGKRYIARLHLALIDAGNGGRSTHTMIAKLYKRTSARESQMIETTRALYGAGFGDRSPVRIPRITAYLSEPHILFMEDLPGTLLPEVPSQQIPDAVCAAGRALARLHRCEIHIPHEHGAENELRLLEGWVDLAAGVFPERAPRFAAALERVARRLGRSASITQVLSHRDFYEKQILIHGPRTYVIDFDTLSMAEPALDLGNFLAHLDLNTATFGARPDTLAKSFLSGYEEPTDAEFGRRVDAYRTATQLRLACIYALRSGGQTVSEQLLAKV